MKISEVLQLVSGFTEYIRYVQTQVDPETGPRGEQLTEWGYLLGVFGPTPCLFGYASFSRLFSPLQAVTIGWDDVHDHRKWIRRPSEEHIKATLGLSDKAYCQIEAATDCLTRHNARLRADLLTACGLPPDSETEYFRSKLRRLGREEATYSD